MAVVMVCSREWLRILCGSVVVVLGWTTKTRAALDSSRSSSSLCISMCAVWVN
jgi:hypothetical protein